MRQESAEGFGSRAAAVAFERDVRARATCPASMPFREFAARYLEEVRPRVRESSYATKKRLVVGKIVPFFKEQALNEVTSLDVLRWQQWLTAMGKRDGTPYSLAYLRNIDGQLSIMFNYAVRNYGLARNPYSSLAPIGSARQHVGKVWNREEFERFLATLEGRPQVRLAFEMLYWTGLREGELLALAPGDICFEARTIAVSKTYQRIGGKEVVGPPKTKKSRRVVTMPQFVCDDLLRYVCDTAQVARGERIFKGLNAGALHREMRRGCAASGVKVIRVHDLRHSHVSLLVQMGFSPAVIAERLGHESTDITFRYAHLFPGEKDAMADALDALRRERQ